MTINITIRFKNKFNTQNIPFIKKIYLSTFNGSTYELVFDDNIISDGKRKDEINYTLIDFNEDKSSNIIGLQDDYTKIYCIKGCHIEYDESIGYEYINQPEKIVSFIINDSSLFVNNHKSALGVTVIDDGVFKLNKAIINTFKFKKSERLYNISSIELSYEDFYHIMYLNGKIDMISRSFNECAKRVLPIFRTMGRGEKISIDDIRMNKVRVINEDGTTEIKIPSDLKNIDYYCWR